MRYYPSIPNQTGFAFGSQLRGQGILTWISILFIYGIVIAVYPIFLLIVVRRNRIERKEPWDQFLLLAITGIAMFMAVAPGMTLLRVAPTSLPALVLLAGQALAMVSLAFAIYSPIHVQRQPWNYLTLPAGRTAIPDQGRYELYRWATAHTNPGELCFGVPYIYIPPLVIALASAD